MKDKMVAGVLGHDKNYGSDGPLIMHFRKKGVLKKNVGCFGWKHNVVIDTVRKAMSDRSTAQHKDTKHDTTKQILQLRGIT